MYRPPVHPEYSTKDYPDGWANIDPLLSYKSNFDGSVQGSKNPELILQEPVMERGLLMIGCIKLYPEQ